jgi:hypothetical protein
LLLSIAAMPGCLLLNWSAAWLSNEAYPSAEANAPNNVLGKIPTPRTAVTVEIVFVERPAGDPLLGSLLWDEVDQIGSLSPENRAALAKAGFRVGRVSAHPPEALQTLMGLTSDFTAEAEKRLVGRRVMLPSGAETEINAGPPELQATIHLPTANGQEPRSFENVRGVFRMKARQLQDGWARIEFLPELHHGQMVNRPIANRGGWQLKTTQEIERLYRQKFSLDLNIGEMVILTAELNAGDCLGRHFFHSPEFTGASPDEKNPGAEPASLGIQRLLIIRLADLKTAKSLYSE